MKHTEIKYLLLLLLTAMIWGSAFVAQSAGMDYVGPFTFLSVRNFLGAIVLLPVIPLLKKINAKDESISDSDNNVGADSALESSTASNKKNTKTLVIGGICAGTVLCIAAALQQIGLQYTAVGKAGFLTALYVIMVPFIEFVVFKKKIKHKIWFCVLLSVVGMALLCLQTNGKIELGDFLELLCALCFSVHILILDHFTDLVDPVKLSCIQFFVCGVISAFPMMIIEKPSLSVIISAWLPICYAGFLSSGVAYTLQAVAQKKCDPTLASLVMCLESVFSAVFGWMILKQALSIREIFGCVLMFVAIVIANIPEKTKQ